MTYSVNEHDSKAKYNIITAIVEILKETAILEPTSTVGPEKGKDRGFKHMDKDVLKLDKSVIINLDSEVNNSRRTNRSQYGELSENSMLGSFRSKDTISEAATEHQSYNYSISEVIKIIKVRNMLIEACLINLTKTISGPCQENQKSILKTKLLSVVNKILSVETKHCENYDIESKIKDYPKLYETIYNKKKSKKNIHSKNNKYDSIILMARTCLVTPEDKYFYGKITLTSFPAVKNLFV